MSALTRPAADIRQDIERIDAECAALASGQRPDNPWAKNLNRARVFLAAALTHLPEPAPSEPTE